MKMSLDKQVRFLMQGTEYGDEKLKNAMSEELRQRLHEADRAGRSLKVYCGFDPTSSDLHLGHTVPMRKLKAFEDLGHEVSFVVGDFTSLVGDPSDRNRTRPSLTREEARRNAETYAEQAFQILDPARTHVRYNSEWLSKLTFLGFMKMASHFSVQQLLSRESFRLRWDRGDALFLHETFYAILQGYDAFFLDADVQVGGSDQLYNIVTVSRKLMSLLGKEPNTAIILDILPGTDGRMKMSKSLGNHIPLMAGPEDMYGMIMSLPDEVMTTYFRLLSRLDPDQIAGICQALESGDSHPRDVKMRLAREVVSIYRGQEAAEKAEAGFIQVFQKRDLPEKIPEFHLDSEKAVLDVLVESGLVSTRSEGRRLIQQRAVRFGGEVVRGWQTKIAGSGVLQVGKRRFLALARKL